MSEQWYIIEKTIDGVLEDFYSRTYPIGICRSPSEGEAICAKLVEEDKMVDDAVAFFDAQIKEWSEAHPFPPFNPPELTKIPKWPSGMSKNLITPEMRQERARIQATNAAVIEAFNKVHNVEVAGYESEKNSYLKSLWQEYLLTHSYVKEYPKVVKRIREYLREMRVYSRHYKSEEIHYRVSEIPVMEAP